MTAIRQVFLRAAVAGVVAGVGSAVGTAVAYAETSASDTHSSAAAADAPSQQAGPSRGRSRESRAGAWQSPRNRSHGSAETRASNENSNALPASAVQRRVSKAKSADQVESVPAATVPEVNDLTDATPAPKRMVSAPAVSPAASTAAVAVTRAVAAAAAPTPAPAAPAPTPLRLPLLPDLPALPVAPAGAVTVSATSGTNSRLRAASAVAQAAALADPPTHVLLIGTDGTNLDKVLQYAYTDGSGFKTLMDQGVTGATSIVGHTTISGPSWSTILTGAWDSKTGVINNLFRPGPYEKWPTAINLLEYNKPAVDTAVIADWKYINDIAGAGGYPADSNTYVAFQNTWAETDAQVTTATIAKIQAIGANPDVSTFLFSYQVQVDEMGHQYGGGSPEYAQAVINVGQNIEQIMAAVKSVEDATGQDWTVVVTTDHGHQQSKGFGHGFQSPNETSSFVIFDLAGDEKNDGKQNLNYSTVDITPTVVNLFGVPLRSDFDGVPMQSDPTVLNSIVTPVNLKQALNDAVSMYGYPNIGTDIALGARTVFATVPYLIDGLISNITGLLQGIVDQDIFLISGLAQITEWIVQFNGDLMVGVTEAVARAVARLTGSGVIPPTDPPLPAPPAGSELLLLTGAVLT